MQQRQRQQLWPPLLPFRRWRVCSNSSRLQQLPGMVQPMELQMVGAALVPAQVQGRQVTSTHWPLRLLLPAKVFSTWAPLMPSTQASCPLLCPRRQWGQTVGGVHTGRQ
jgi:hypothetical protein